VNLSPVRPDDLQLLAFGNYGHYTSMQVRDGNVRGLDLHLARLDANAEELFGCAPGAGRVLEALLHAVPTSGACSVRVTLFSRELRRVVAGDAVEPDIMVMITPAAAADATAMRVLPVHYEREMPQIKHLATYGLLRQMRVARMAGYDDALFVDSSGRVSEGCTWNVCLHDGSHWHWPEAPMLEGVTMQLLRSAMSDEGWPVRTAPVEGNALAPFTGAFATNSVSAARPISAIGVLSFAGSASQGKLLNDLFESVPWQSFQ
jgi:branched-subunit amino acid aminotransferase/4-amino-4-deoxychorismate lyase